MPDLWARLTSQPGAAWVAACILAGLVLAVGLILRRCMRGKATPEELERRRRATLHREGKMGDGEIVDVETEPISIVYSYSVAGVAYTASQDLDALQSLLPANPMTMAGPVSVKFNPRNPANSMVLCEDWSGLRNRT